MKTRSEVKLVKVEEGGEGCREIKKEGERHLRKKRVGRKSLSFLTKLTRCLTSRYVVECGCFLSYFHPPLHSRLRICVDSIIYIMSFILSLTASLNNFFPCSFVKSGFSLDRISCLAGRNILFLSYFPPPKPTFLIIHSISLYSLFVVFL